MSINLTTNMWKRHELKRLLISLSVSGRRLMASGKKVRPGTIQQYQSVLILLEAFEQSGTSSLRIQLLQRASFRLIQRERHYWIRFFKDFSLFLYKVRHCYDRYVGSGFKVIKTFFHYLALDKALPVGEFHKKFRIPLERFTPVILSPVQLKFLITNVEFENSLSNTLKRVKDIFVFGSTVALRFQDLMRLKKTNIQHAVDGIYIVLHTQKTGAEIKVPLPGYALEIIDRYKRKAGSFILPRLSCSNLNIDIKKLIKKAGWDYNLPKIRYRRGEPVEIKTKAGESYQFCDHITAHTMRRTSITTLLLMGVDENSVRRISGHAPGSTEFYRYVVVVQEYLNKKVKEAFLKLLNVEEIPVLRV